MRTTCAKAWGVLALALGVLVLTGTALAGNGDGNGGNGNGEGPPATPPGQEKKQEATPPPAPAPAPAPAAAKAPGQVKKATAKAPPRKASPPAKAKPKATKSASGSQSSGESSSQSSSSPEPRVTICHRTGSETSGFVEITISQNGLNGHRHHGDLVPAPATGCPAAQQNTHDGDDDHANGKVTICHATGSATNPYVEITISENGLNGHDGHGDLNPVPAGGCPTTPPPASVLQQQEVTHEVKSEQASCPATTETRTERVLVGVWHKTGSETNEFVWITPNEASAHLDATKHEDDQPVYETRTTVVSTGQVCSTSTTAPPPAGTTFTVLSAGAQPVSTSSAPLGSFPAPIVEEPVILKDVIPPSGEDASAGGVAGVSATLPQRKKERGGVLAATRTLGATAVRGRLPFTGLPLWPVALAATALVAAGVILRRRSQFERP